MDFLLPIFGEQYARKVSLFFAALLFGLWHLVTPFRSLLDGEMTSFVAVLIFMKCRKKNSKAYAN